MYHSTAPGESTSPEQVPKLEHQPCLPVSEQAKAQNKEHRGQDDQTPFGKGRNCRDRGKPHCEGAVPDYWIDDIYISGQDAVAVSIHKRRHSWIRRQGEFNG